MIDYILNFQFNTWLALGLYWVPLVLCLIGYSVRSWKEYQDDIASIYAATQTHQYGSVHGDLTVGLVLRRLLNSVTPGLNLLCLIFSIGYSMLRSIVEVLDSFLSISIAGSYKYKDKQDS